MSDNQCDEKTEDTVCLLFPKGVLWAISLWSGCPSMAGSPFHCEIVVVNDALTASKLPKTVHPQRKISFFVTVG